MQMVLTFIATLILLVFIVFNSIKDEEVRHKQILMASINSFAWALMAFLYDDYIKDRAIETYIFIASIVEYLIVLIVIRIILNRITVNNLYQRVFKKSMTETKYSHYYIVDSSDRIKDISKDFLNDLGKKYDEVIGKKIFDVFDDTVRFVSLDGVSTTNQGFKAYYKKISWEKALKFTAQFRNVNQDLITICIIEEPVISRGKYYGRISISERHTEGEVLEVERNLLSKNEELSTIQSRFVATLQVTDDNLFYLELDKRVLWANDNLKNGLGLDLNTIDAIDYQAYIYPDDLYKYKEALKDCVQKGGYKTTYRFKANGEYIWVKEKGTYVEKGNLIVAKIDLQDESNYVKTNTELDDLKTEDDLELQIQRMINSNRVFEIVCIGIDNMPDINDRRGMRFGNMAISEYVRKIKKNFLSTNEELYRVAGVDFAFILTDVKMMEMLKRGLEVDGKSIYLNIEYGGISEELRASVGVSRNGVDSSDARELIVFAKKALRTAKNPNYIRNYCYYRDMQWKII